MSNSDPLILLRTSLAASKPPKLTTSSSSSDAPSRTTDSFSTATHLYFPYPTPRCLPLDTPTRFTSSTPDTAQVDLRSIWFAWVHKDITVPRYIASAQELDKTLPEGQRIRNLVFVERIDLITWLEGASEDSEYIQKPADAPGTDAAAAKAEGIVAGAGVPAVQGSDAAATQTGPGGRPGRTIDARLQAIYNGERKMADHNSILRGIKPTDFSHVRKHAETFLGRRNKPNSAASTRPIGSSKPLPNRPGTASLIPQPTASTLNTKRTDPIILLSPSASSLLRVSNIKSFLDSGLYVPADHPTLSSQPSNILHVTRTLPSLQSSTGQSGGGSSKPFRFIIVDSPDAFKPEYWSRVVAVFTTGQTWQFRGYKWREPQELFTHVLGVYVGEKGLPVPNEVKGWGSAVRRFEVERWDERAHGSGVEWEERRARRWRDREVVEELWRGLEGWMGGRGEWRR